MQKATTLKTQRRAVSLPRLWHPGFEHFAIATVVLTYGLIVLGGAVRATDSGTACPDWPLCHGQVLPRLDGHVLVEYAHRLVASFVGLLIFVMAIWSWRRNRGDQLVERAALLAVALLLVQVLVGAATVNTETQASVVAIHLSIALSLFATLIILAIAASAPRAAGNADVPGLFILVAIGAFALIITGAYVSQEGAGLAYPDWPLFDGKLVSSGGRLADLHYAHRLLAAGLGVLLLVLAVRTWQREKRSAILVAIALALVIYCAQVLVGAANIWFELATSLQISHLALASALWGVIVFAAAWSYLRPVESREVADQ
jgi:heme A synthase